ncbi:Thaumatin-like protein [Morella rubra]|uniref:Thaumatin-like protein n=1 Tax=Morella rubra TaxID=262757 RepID=A0A6A1VR74_9ROSI|nr:Thaumatin-like protein [Morella rubra]
MSLSKKLFIFCFLSITLDFGLARAARFDVTNNCPFTVWARAVPGGGMQLAQGGIWSLTLPQAPQGVTFGHGLGAISMAMGGVAARPVIVAGFSNAKPMVYHRTPLLNLD